MGLEPTTTGLKGQRSTDWANPVPWEFSENEPNGKLSYL